LTTDEDVLKSAPPLGLEYTDEDLLQFSVITGPDGRGVKTRRIMPSQFPDLRVAEEMDLGVKMDSNKTRARRQKESAKL
jgi:hypothetical protein